MGMAASQARLLSITARKSSNEFSGQQINQQRVTLSNNANAIWTNMLTLQVPTPPSSQDFRKTVYKFETQDGANASIKRFIKNPPGPYGYIVEYEIPKKVPLLSNLGTESGNIKIEVNALAKSDAYIKANNKWIQLAQIDKNIITDEEIKTSLNNAQYVYTYTIQDDEGNNIQYYLVSDTELTRATITEKENGLDYNYPIFFKDKNNVLNKIENQKLKAIETEQENSNLSFVIDESTGETIDLEYVEQADVPETMEQGTNNKFVYRYSQGNDEKGNPIYKYIVYDEKLSSKNINTGTLGSILDIQKWEFKDSYVEETEKKSQNANIKMSAKGQIEKIYFEDGTDYKLSIEEDLDNDAYDKAMVKYNYQKDLYDKELNDLNARIKIIQSQDQTLEVRLKNIDTEHKALDTEMESVKKVLEKNIESSFKTFA
ncbi:MAG: hypothetical protein MRZ90_06800 [Candidatus Gastranaerophilales bacterium]|nr:hypothetical protein [Candidatus Gastranaerophilales bacterium]